MKVLWFSNIELTDELKGTGGWIFAMANLLIKEACVELHLITQGDVQSVTKKEYKTISQWIFPPEPLKTNGLPSLKTIREIQSVVNEIQPEIIHVWGMENYWGLLTARGLIRGNVILEIQGLRFEIAKHFYSGLSMYDLLNCFGYAEIRRPLQSLIGAKYSFTRWGKFEKEMLRKHKFISTQSNWVRANIFFVSPMAQIFNTSIRLRQEFLDADKWEFENCKKYQIFTSTSSETSYKGLHILLDAIFVLKIKYPQLKLCIAAFPKVGFKHSGYSNWINKKINYLNLGESITWLGPMDAGNLVIQMQEANVVVVPSFIESYSLSFDEALTIGVPTVASFAGAMPELASHEFTSLFFPPGDSIMCANAISRYFANPEFAKLISQNSYQIKRTNNKFNPTELQLSIYNKILSNE